MTCCSKISPPDWFPFPKSGFSSSLQTTRLIHLAATAPRVPQPGDPPGTSWARSSSDSPTNPPWKACSLLQHRKKKKKKEKVNEKTSWKRRSTVNATAVMLHLSCKEKIKFCLPPEMSLGKIIPSFSKWQHIVSSLQLAASLVSQPVFPGQ